MRTSLRAFLVLLTVLVPACARSTASTKAEPAPRTTVRVDNQGFPDMDIYVLRSGQRIRLGFVNGHSTATFTIPANLIFGATPLRFMADPVAGNRAPVSEEITVAPGDEVVLQIPPG